MTQGKYLFIANMPTPQQRKKLGYYDLNDKYDFVLKLYESEKNYEIAEKIVFDADIVIYGGVERDLVKRRLRRNKLTFRAFERIYKVEPKKKEMPRWFVRNFFANTVHSKFYLLCEGAYVASDYARTATFLNKAYKWGYFPKINEYEDIVDVIKKKKKNSILWVGRLIDWKHPEIPLGVAKRLKADGYDFEINIIGTGALEYHCVAAIERLGLGDYVHMLGSMSPDEVRTHMENSEIFIFSSDRKEGWGAVLNEAMNSACAVVANEAIGSVPYLINDGINGLIYSKSGFDEAYEKVKYLIDNSEKREELGKNAYFTMLTEWNAKVAAERLLGLADELKKKKKCVLYQSGPCSQDKRKR